MSAQRANSEKTHQRRLGREWLAGAVRTGLWVVIITVLIWVYADLQFTEERNVRATLQIHTGSSSNLVLVTPAEDVTVSFRVKGNRYSIDAFIARLASANWRLRYDAARDLDPGSHVERTTDVLGRLIELREAGLQVVSANPRNFGVHLDRLELVESVPVDVQFTGGEAEEPEVQPERVNLQVPASWLGEQNPSDLVMKTEPFDLSRYDLGANIRNVSVAVLPPRGVRGARLFPARVRVSCKVGWQSKREFNVRVDVEMPKVWLEDGTWNRYAIKYKPTEQWTRRITIHGNRIDLERLRQEQIKAYVELTEAAKNVESWEPAEVKVILPPGLKARLAPEPIAPVEYRLEVRSSAPAAP